MRTDILHISHIFECAVSFELPFFHISPSKYLKMEVWNPISILFWSSESAKFFSSRKKSRLFSYTIAIHVSKKGIKILPKVGVLHDDISTIISSPRFISDFKYSTVKRIIDISHFLCHKVHTKMKYPSFIIDMSALEFMTPIIEISSDSPSFTRLSEQFSIVFAHGS